MCNVKSEGYVDLGFVCTMYLNTSKTKQIFYKKYVMQNRHKLTFLSLLESQLKYQDRGEGTEVCRIVFY